MPHRCCVPDCKSNSTNEKTMFLHSSFQRIQQESFCGVKKSRKNFEPTSTTSICIKHFHCQFLKKGNADNSRIIIPRNKDAYPSFHLS